MSEPIEVIIRVGGCPCPGTPHAEEHVFLEPEATLEMSTRAWMAMRNADADLAAQIAALANAFIPAAIRSWTFLREEAGELIPEPVTKENAERLVPWDKGGFDLINKADELYSGRVTAPFAQVMASLTPKPSRRGPTDTSTSPSLPSGSPPPAPSAPSSQNGSAGKAYAGRAR